MSPITKMSCRSGCVKCIVYSVSDNNGGKLVYRWTLRSVTEFQCVHLQLGPVPQVLDGTWCFVMTGDFILDKELKESCTDTAGKVSHYCHNQKRGFESTKGHQIVDSVSLYKWQSFWPQMTFQDLLGWGTKGDFNGVFRMYVSQTNFYTTLRLIHVL